MNPQSISLLPAHPFCAIHFLHGDGTAAGHAAACGNDQVPLHVGAKLFERGSSPLAVYVVQSGLVKESIPGPDGEECIVRLVTRSHLAGLSALTGEPHQHSGFVMQAGVACRIPIARLEWMRQADPGACRQMLSDWRQSADDSDRILVEFIHGPARVRVARALLYLHSVPRGDARFCPRRTDVADLLAITPVSVSRLLAGLRREGLIAITPDHCMTLDVVGLRRLGYPNDSPAFSESPGSRWPGAPAAA